jgi:endonuclease/exonuclease/phosphatase family metal-dependent hydrolase
LGDIRITKLTVLSWNVFHGRDAPPDPELHRAAWHLSATPIDNGTFLQVNQSLAREFAGVIASARWSVCLLQEVPPAWAPMLGRICGAHVHRTLTSRNQLACVTRLIGHWRPDLLGAWEGGSNMILVRPPLEIIRGSGRALLLNGLWQRMLAERRRMSFVRLRSSATREELCVANLHASALGRAQAEREVRRAAGAAASWSRETPLVFGGDLNLMPRSSKLFDELERELQLRGATAPNAIDHLLVRGLEVIRPATRWPDERRDLRVRWRGGTRAIRLSDHAPIEALLETPPMR